MSVMSVRIAAPPADVQPVVKESFAAVVSRAIATGGDRLGDALLEAVPEMKWYTAKDGGEIAVTPGITEPLPDAELYRTVGALVALYSQLKNQPDLVNFVAGVNTDSYTAYGDQFVRMCNLKDPNGPERNVMYYLMATHDVGKSSNFRALVNRFLSDEQKTDNHDTVLGHAFDIASSDPTRPGYAEVNAALPNLRRLPHAHQRGLAAAFLSDFHLPQLMQGESSVLALRGLFKANLTKELMAMYLYHSIFDVAGGGCTKPGAKPAAIKPVYEWSKVIVSLLELSPPDDVTGYHSILFDAAKKVDSMKDLLGDTYHFHDTDEFVFLRFMAMSRNSFADPAKVKAAIKGEEFATLRSELSGGAGNPQIMIYYAPDLVQKTLVKDDADKEDYVSTLHVLDKLFKMARAELAGNSREMTFEVNVDKLNKHINEIKKASPVFGGLDLLNLVNSSMLSLEVNEAKTEALLVLH